MGPRQIGRHADGRNIDKKCHEGTENQGFVFHAEAEVVRQLVYQKYTDAHDGERHQNKCHRQTSLSFLLLWFRQALSKVNE